MEKDKIATYYANARELIKQNNPKAARAYVLAVLNYAVESYNSAQSIRLKAKTAAFLDKWIAVSRDLYDKGITDYVLRCFGFPSKAEQELPKVEKPNPPKKADPKIETPAVPASSAIPVAPARVEVSPTVPGEIDISGLIDSSAKTQGWCAEVFEKNKAAVVEISVSNSDSGACGTGFIISENGYLLTNDHVVYDEEAKIYYPKMKMTFAGGKKSFKINVLFSDKNADVALCSFRPEEVGEFSVIKRIPDYSQVLQGADCLVIGNAFGMGLAPFSGVIRFTKNDCDDLVYSAPSNPGDSGGPVLNRQGECIGINKSKTVAVNNVSVDGFANATPMDEINALLEKWTSANDIRL